MAALQLLKTNKMFGGFNRRYTHDSQVLGCKMVFTIFFPPAAETSKVPAVYFLGGLTCNDENFIIKSGAQRRAAALGLALIAPDTSPRGVNIPGESDSWDFGLAAGFYVDATQPPWSGHYKMYSYVTQELPEIINMNCPELDLSKAGVMGHSMGGHGALVLGLRNPALYASISALAPICNPSNVPWGQKAFSGYLGSDTSTWGQYDATQLIRDYQGPHRNILVDTGSADDFLEKQLKPKALEAAARDNTHIQLHSRIQEGYDHSYFFIATFIDEHLDHHAAVLKA